MIVGMLMRGDALGIAQSRRYFVENSERKNTTRKILIECLFVPV